MNAEWKLGRVERDRIVERCTRLKEAAFPRAPASEAPEPEAARRREAYYVALAEYADRLPRVPMSVCPYCEEPLVRSYDPWGVDGPWWHLTRPFPLEEPKACEHFRVLLGAYTLTRPTPEEAQEPVKPGPDVPFLVPALLGLAGMRAVVAELPMERGDRPFPIAYFSNRETAPELLHQPWLRDTHWFRDANGKWSWNVANDEFDFVLAPYWERGILGWADLTANPPEHHKVSDGSKCPYLALAGERLPQLFASGRRDFLELPTGETPVPFGEPDDPPPFQGDLEKLKKEAYAFLDTIAPQLELTPEEIEELGGPPPADD